MPNKPTPETLALGGIMPQFTRLTDAELDELSKLVSTLFTNQAAPPWLKPTLVERALLELRYWRKEHP